jgi:starch synthase (maltosyl-transferring)
MRETKMTRTLTSIPSEKPAASVAATDGKRRAVISGVAPEIEAGRFPIKRTAGERVVVEADAFADGHDKLACVLKHRRSGDSEWIEMPMQDLGNDRWRGEFTVEEPGRYAYTVAAWTDAFLSWRNDLERRTDEDDIALALLAGADLVAAAAARADGKPASRLHAIAETLKGAGPTAERRATALAEELRALMARYADRQFAALYPRELEVVVDIARARYSSWYEMFPRSCSVAGRHGSFRDCEARLAYIAELGFDVLYLPPIHPVGRVKRKGKNNALSAGPREHGSPWAIGAKEGGHKSVHPELGSIEDFRGLVARARERGIEIALDIAFQCAPDHPYVGEHPEWFRHRPDGSVQYAENPPKKYEDIYPFNFETEDWPALWDELKSIFEFWHGEGVRIFRVDNPHTKPFAMWEWIIADLKRKDPGVIFLAEAFTRPKVMYRLAKLGFTQSYTYFSWRNTKRELTEYFTELTQTEVREFFRPNLWPNTPDILTEYLQFGGRPAFMTRFALAATLGASYGIYGPAFELCENRPREPGSEEYLDSEKYEIRQWDLARPDSLKDFIVRVNRIRRENPALHHDWNLRFHPVDNDELICYGKATRDLDNIIVVVVNLDCYHVQSGWVELPLQDLGLDPEHPYQMHDLLSDARYLWHGARNFVQLDPGRSPAHIFRLRRRVHNERDFDYFL